MIDTKQLSGLEEQIKNADKEIKILRKSWAEEIAKLSKDPTFDAFSKKGEKKLAEVAEKYVELIMDAEDRHDEFVEEYNKIVIEMSPSEKVDR